MKFIAKILAHGAYYMGHTVWVIMDNQPFERVVDWLYPVYSRLMRFSCAVSDKYQLDIWRKQE